MGIDYFIPTSEEEEEFFNLHSALSKAISKLIRTLPADKRLAALKETNISDVSLMELYLWSIQQEDYETSIVAKTFLSEKGIAIPRD